MIFLPVDRTLSTGRHCLNMNSVIKFVSLNKVLSFKECLTSNSVPIYMADNYSLAIVTWFILHLQIF